MEDAFMTSRRPTNLLALFLLAVAFFPLRSTAQSPVDPGKLPARTTFYLLWHGSPSGDLRAKNSLYALWDDPDLAPARSAFLASLMNPNEKQKDKPALSREEAAQYLTLLDNPFLVGYFRAPESVTAALTAKPAASTSKSTAAPEKPAWNGLYLIYDRSGKEDLLSKAVLRLRGSETELPKLTTLTVAGVPALKVERKSEVTYWAEFSKYAVSAQELSVFEDILNLLNGKPAAVTLSQVEAFNEAKPLLNGGLLEVFFNASHLKELALTSAPGGPTAQFKPFLNALKVDSLHSFAARLSLEGSRTRLQGVLLGDTAPGGLFDIFSEGQAHPASMAFLSPDTLYYSESQIDFVGIYKMIKRAITQAAGASAQQINMLETAAATRIGMPLEDALGLTTGEFASLQTNPAFDKNQQVYFLGIRNKPDTLKLARTLLGDRISSERNEGSTTYLKVSLQGGQSSAGVTQWNFYYVAVTPHALLGASKSETLRAYIERSAGGEPAPPQALQTARAQFPEKLNGMTFFDFQKVDWAALKADWIAEANKAKQTAKSTDAAKNNANFANWLSQIPPDTIPKHLHTLAGAGWKDAKGAHFDEWLD
jgi:hypothetical protein